MSTSLRSELSMKNRYYIPKHRYLELKHFCLQYPGWKRKYNYYSFLHPVSELRIQNGTGEHADTTFVDAAKLATLSWKMRMVEECAKDAGEDLSELLLKAVTEGLSYSIINPPCCKEAWYTMYRKFYALLDIVRG